MGKHGMTVERMSTQLVANALSRFHDTYYAHLELQERSLAADNNSGSGSGSGFDALWSSAAVGPRPAMRRGMVVLTSMQGTVILPCHQIICLDPALYSSAAALALCKRPPTRLSCMMHLLCAA